MPRLSDFDYELPEDRIAQQPLEDRSSSKLLHLDRATGSVHHRTFRDIGQILRAGDLLVVNDTRVSALRVFGKKPTGGNVEILLLRQLDSDRFEALVKPGKRLKPGSSVFLKNGLTATIEEELESPKRAVRITGSANIDGALRAIGFTPLPPYIRDLLQDPERYQTVYGRIGGSAAAPTAGLHFTPELLAELESTGIEVATVTLDVSLDTFRPVESENLDEHKMHGEIARLPESTVDRIEKCRGRIVAVGTTAVRTLESFATGQRRVVPGEKNTKLFIKPGYEFRIVDGMLTNFHMPRTTMMVLISAFAGRESVLNAYHEALRRRYRFLSFGDAMLII